jgi:Cas10/Cmr2, second palm domain
LNLPTLEELRQELEAGLAAALHESAPAAMTHDTARQGAAQVLAGRGLPEELAAVYGDEPVCRLLCFDADHIQKWVFDSERVQVAAGASHLLDHLNQHVGDAVGEIPGVTGKLYSAGGSGILFASTAPSRRELVDRTRAWLEGDSWLGKRKHELTFSVLAEDLYVADLGPGGEPRTLPAGGAEGLDRFQVVDGMQGALVRAQIRMRAEKESCPRLWPRARLEKRRGVRLERCPSCGHRNPGKTPVTGPGPEFWCGWCLGIRRWIRQREDRPFERDGEPITFAALAESVRRSRQYLGFIALDGNAMGSIVQGMRSFLQLRAFSEATTHIYRSALTQAQETLRQSLRDDWDARHGALSLLSGGDEITLVMAAAPAPEVALRILKSVEEGFDELTRPGALLGDAFADDPGLLRRLRQAGSAAGVITAHANYPVRLMRRYANELQKEAKRACAERGLRSGIAWRLLTDSSPLTRKIESQDRDDMTLDAFEDLLAAARAAREVALPASALHGLVSQYRTEARALRVLAGRERQEALAAVAANFFRYQLIRNDQLHAWWRKIRPGAGPGKVEEKTSAAEPPADAVARWFAAGGGRRLEALVELLSLDPFPTLAGGGPA